MNRALDAAVCANCGRVVFPARLLCPRCGGSEWRRQRLGSGVVEQVTIVRRAPGGFDGPVRLGSVRLDGGPVVTARLEPGASAGSRVRVTLEDGGPVARTP